MRILTGFLPPSRGKVSLEGFDVVEKSLEVRRRVGYLPETVPLYTEMTVTSYLKYMGTLRAMSPARIKVRLDEVIGVCRLGDYRKTQIGKLSKGFRQRVGIAQAIIHEPEVLVLDEPTIGIDPIQVVETRNLIQEIGPRPDRGVEQPHPARSQHDLRAGADHPRRPDRGGGHPEEPGPRAARRRPAGSRDRRARRPGTACAPGYPRRGGGQPPERAGPATPTWSRPSRGATCATTFRGRW